MDKYVAFRFRQTHQGGLSVGRARNGALPASAYFRMNYAGLLEELAAGWLMVILSRLLADLFPR